MGGIRIPTNTDTNTCTYRHACRASAYIYAHNHWHIYTHTRILRALHIHLCTYMCTYIYISVHTCMHTDIYLTHMLIPIYGVKSEMVFQVKQYVTNPRSLRAFSDALGHTDHLEYAPSVWWLLSPLSEGYGTPGMRLAKPTSARGNSPVTRIKQSE